MTWGSAAGVVPSLLWLAWKEWSVPSEPRHIVGPLLAIVACRKGGTCGQDGRNEWKGPLPKEAGLGYWHHVPGAAETPAASGGRTQDRIT